MSTDSTADWSEGYEAGYAAAVQDELDRERRARRASGPRDETTIFGCPVWRLKELGVDDRDLEMCLDASPTGKHSARTEAALRRVANLGASRNDERPRPSTSTPNPSNYEDKGSPPWPPFVGRAASRVFRRKDRSSLGE